MKKVVNPYNLCDLCSFDMKGQNYWENSRILHIWMTRSVQVNITSSLIFIHSVSGPWIIGIGVWTKTTSKGTQISKLSTLAIHSLTHWIVWKKMINESASVNFFLFHLSLAILFFPVSRYNCDCDCLWKRIYRSLTTLCLLLLCLSSWFSSRGRQKVNRKLMKDEKKQVTNGFIFHFLLSLFNYVQEEEEEEEN